MKKSLLDSLRKRNFKPTKLEESADRLPNPDRGFFQIHTFVLGEETNITDRQYTLNGEDTIAMALIDISKYNDKELDDEALKQLREIFTFFRDYRIDIVLRIVYDTQGRCLEVEPKDSDIIIRHMQQLVDVIVEFSDCIFIYQGLLVGNWGEMHSSQFLSPSKLREISKVFFEKVEDSIFLAVRKPVYVRILFPDGMDLRQSRVGIFDDAILASPTHMGTFGDIPEANMVRELAWKPEDEINYVSNLCVRVPYGGEALHVDAKDSLILVRNSLKEMSDYFRNIHLTYLNRIYDPNFIEHIRKLKWLRKDAYFGMDGYDYLERHMGYRYVIQKAEVQNDGETNTLKLSIENVGFANSYFDSECFVYSRTPNGEEIDINVDEYISLRSIEAGEIETFEIKLPKLKDKLYFYARKKNGGEIYFANKSSDGGKGILLGEFLE